MSDRISVLVVEDEAMILLDIATQHEADGFKVYEASNADDAIRLLTEHSDLPLVFTDIDMPGSMDGLKLAAAPLASNQDHSDLGSTHGGNHRYAEWQRVLQQALWTCSRGKVDARNAWLAGVSFLLAKERKQTIPLGSLVRLVCRTAEILAGSKRTWFATAH